MDLKLSDINNTNVKVAEHWRKLTGLFGKHKFIKELEKRANQDRIQLEQKAAIKIQSWWRGILNDRRNIALNQIRVQKFNCDQEKICINEGGQTQIEHIAITKIQAWWRGILYRRTNIAFNQIRVQKFNCDQEKICINEGGQTQIDQKAAIKIQAWWRGILYRQRKMLPEHKEKLRICVEELRNAPCSEENPKQERNEPLNVRIERYIFGLRSIILTERKAMSLRLNRLADRSHVAIECMLGRNIFNSILDCLSELNRSEAHLYVSRPLSALTVKLLSERPFVDPFALQHLNGLLSTAINLIHKNYKDAEVVNEQVKVLKLLSGYTGFAENMVALRFDWYMQKFNNLFGRLIQQKQNEDPRLLAYKRLCKLQKLINIPKDE